MDVEDLVVEHPNFMWFAALTDAPWAKDPADGRYDDVPPLRWDRMVVVLQQLTGQLRQATQSAEDPTQPLTLTARFAGLDTDERWTLATFFLDPIDVDPWSASLSDGRHRTWSAWNASPTTLLPFQSMLLHDALVVDDPMYTAVECRDQYRRDLLQVAAREAPHISSRVSRTAPAYAESLRQLAAC